MSDEVYSRYDESNNNINNDDESNNNSNNNSNNDSQCQYGDDEVLSYCPPPPQPCPPEEIPVQAEAEAEVEVEERPDQSVKACKDICVIFAHDLSGSMDRSRKMIADGTNEFLQDLQARYAMPCDFQARFCLITFAGDRIEVGEWTNVHAVPMFNVNSFACSGSTPLWDACGVGLEKLGRDCEGCTAALYVFTDGDDNNSKIVSRSDVRDQVSKLNPAIHTMLFIGSDPMSSAGNADAIGATRTKSLNPSSDNTPSAMRACTNAIARCVTGETQTPEFNDGDIMMSEGGSSSSAQTNSQSCCADEMPSIVTRTRSAVRE